MCELPYIVLFVQVTCTVMQIVKIQRAPYVRIQSASSIISHGARFPIVAVLEWSLEHNGMSK